MKHKIPLTLLSLSLIITASNTILASDIETPEQSETAYTDTAEIASSDSTSQDDITYEEYPSPTIYNREIISQEISYPTNTEHTEGEMNQPENQMDINIDESVEGEAATFEETTTIEGHMEESEIEDLTAGPKNNLVEVVNDEIISLATSGEDIYDAWNHATIVYDTKLKCMKLVDEESGKLDEKYTGWYSSNIEPYNHYYLIKGIALTGLQKIGGTVFYFDIKDGLCENECIIPIDKNNQSVYNSLNRYDEDACLNYSSPFTLYYIDEDGVWRQDANGWHTITDDNGDSEKVYLINGIAQQGFKTIEGKHYYFEDIPVPVDLYEDRGEVCGALFEDMWFWTEDCFLYYSMPNGQLAEGFKTIYGYPYYFWPKTEKGHYSRTMATGWFKVNGFTYYAIPYIRGKGYDNIYDYPDSGVLVSGFKTIDGKGYYFWPKTENGHYSKTMAKGWFTVNGFKYYANSDGILTTGFKTISGRKYYFWPKTSGGHYSKTMAKGWFTLNGFKYYADKNGALASGWKTISGKKYYFWPKTSGGHYANTMAKGKVRINGRWYYFKNNGVKR